LPESASATSARGVETDAVGRNMALGSLSVATSHRALTTAAATVAQVKVRSAIGRMA
jgi:hypothetical protein